MFQHSGTPPGITAAFDCAARNATWHFGRSLLPERASFVTLFDALQLQACGLARPLAVDEYVPPTFSTPRGSIFVDAAVGSDDAAGSSDEPLQTLEAAAAAARGRRNATIVLRAGVHRVARTVALSAEHVNLTIQNYEGERASLSGARGLAIPAAAWQPYRVGTGDWVVREGSSLVLGRAVAGKDSGPVKFLGVRGSAAACQASASRLDMGGFAYHDRTVTGFEQMCYGVERDAFTWATEPQRGVTSGFVDRQNTWVADVSSLGLTEQIVGLRRNGRRSIRARYPNGDPELSGDWLTGAEQGMGGGDYVKGWVPLSARSQWVKPARRGDPFEAVATGADWPGVEWPQYAGPQDGEGDRGAFRIGIGGYCQHDLADPVAGPSGYWCSNRPSRGQCWDRKTNRGTGTRLSPCGGGR